VLQKDGIFTHLPFSSVSLNINRPRLPRKTPDGREICPVSIEQEPARHGKPPNVDCPANNLKIWPAHNEMAAHKKQKARVEAAKAVENTMRELERPLQSDPAAELTNTCRPLRSPKVLSGRHHKFPVLCTGV
jgi:hypothetical protein